MVLVAYVLQERGCRATGKNKMKKAQGHTAVFDVPQDVDRGNLPLMLGQVRAVFPLGGRFHFRAKFRPDPQGAPQEWMWMDLTEDQTPIPMFDGTSNHVQSAPPFVRRLARRFHARRLAARR